MEGETPAPLNKRRDKMGGIVPTEGYSVSTVSRLWLQFKVGQRNLSFYGLTQKHKISACDLLLAFSLTCCAFLTTWMHAEGYQLQLHITLHQGNSSRNDKNVTDLCCAKR